jgi:hypothetical protein
MTIHEKLLAVQSALKAPKTQVNSFAKYSYRSCEDILEAVKPLLKENGLTLTLSDQIEMIGSRFYVRATACVTIGETSISATAFAREPEQKKGSDESQITGAASSYARKYALNGLFCIDDTKDADTMDNSAPVQKASPDKAHSGAIMEITNLCKDTATDMVKLYAYYNITGVPTKAEAETMIAALKKKLGSQLDSSSK